MSGRLGRKGETLETSSITGAGPEIGSGGTGEECTALESGTSTCSTWFSTPSRVTGEVDAMVVSLGTSNGAAAS